MEIYLIVIAIAFVIIGLLVYMIVRLTAQRDVERTKAENYAGQLQNLKVSYEKQLSDQKLSYDGQIVELKETFAHQLQQTKEVHEGQIAALKEMNEKQIKTQLDLIKEQMQTTSEKVLKMRQEELGAQLFFFQTFFPAFRVVSVNHKADDLQAFCMILVVERAQLGQDIELVTIPALPEVQHDIPFADVLFQLVGVAQRVCKEHVFIMLPRTAFL